MRELPWLSLLALGALHGINPAMGWLFAVGRGLHEQDRRAVYRALGPLALGHTLAIGVAILAALTLGALLPLQWLRWCVAATLVLIGVDGLRHHRHVSLGSMRVTGRELAAWSFLMASIHGAGLMVLPFVLPGRYVAAANHHHSMPALASLSPMPGSLGVTAPLIHTVGYLAMTALLAAIVYEKVGLRILRKAWINLNAVWAAALIGAGALTLLP
jgi:hypothetical protein